MTNVLKDVADKIISTNKYKVHREKFLLLLDLFVIIFAYFLTKYVEYNEIITLHHIWMGLVVIFLHTVTLIYFGVYRSLWKYFGIVEIKRIVLANFVSTICLIIIALLFLDSTKLAKAIIAAEVVATIFIFVVRFVYRALRDTKYQSAFEKRVLIVGAGDAGYILQKDIRNAADKRKEAVVGFIDDYKVKKEIEGIKVLGAIDDLPKVVKNFDISQIYIAMPSVELKYQQKIYDICQELKIQTKVMRQIDHRMSGEHGQLKYPVENVSIVDLLGRGQVSLNDSELSHFITGKVIVVTGAGGSIGSELCRQIMKFNPERLVMIDINENALYMLEFELRRTYYNQLTAAGTVISSFIASVRDYEQITNIFKEVEPFSVYHAAAHKHVPLMETRPQEAILNNIVGTNNVIDASIENNVANFILISTDKSVNPTNVMGATKRVCEMILQSKKSHPVTKLGAVRFGNVLGSNGSVIPIFNEQIKAGGPITLTHKDITRYFMSIPEAAQLVLQAGCYASNGDIFVLDMGEPVKIYDLAKKLIRLSGYEPYEEIDIVETGLRQGEKMYEELSLENEEMISTENSLIYINKSQEIDQDKLFKGINDLHSMIKSNAKPSELKKELFKIIE